MTETNTKDDSAIPQETAEWHEFLKQHCAEQERLRLERLARCAQFEMGT